MKSYWDKIFWEYSEKTGFYGGFQNWNLIDNFWITILDCCKYKPIEIKFCEKLPKKRVFMVGCKTET